MLLKTYKKTKEKKKKEEEKKRPKLFLWNYDFSHFKIKGWIKIKPIVFRLD
jgi:hypothetical protein